MDTNVKYVEICQATEDDGITEAGWFFNAVAGNGEIVTTSEIYTRKEDAERGAEGVFPGIKQVTEDEEAKDGD